MKVLLTGATGFVGSHVADQLISRGHEVRAIVRRSSNLRWLDNAPVETIVASLADPHSLRDAVQGVDMIIHVAGLTAARNADEFMRGNRDGTRNLIEASERYAPGIQKFLHVSSLAAAGPAGSLNRPSIEDDPCAPITAYGLSKKAAEEVVLSKKDVLPVTVVRPPAVYGPRDTAILTFFQSVARGIAPLIGFDKKYVSLVHVYDLARGIVDAASTPATDGKTYFIASEEFYTWEQIVTLTKKALGRKYALTVRVPHPLVYGIAGLSEFFGRFMTKPPVLNFEKGRDITRSYWICSVERARRDFGYRQEVPIEEGIKITCDWYRKHGWL